MSAVILLYCCNAHCFLPFFWTNLYSGSFKINHKKDKSVIYVHISNYLESEIMI